jgi:hypothetical protein
MLIHLKYERDNVYLFFYGGAVDQDPVECLGHAHGKSHGQTHPTCADGIPLKSEENSKRLNKLNYIRINGRYGAKQ